MPFHAELTADGQQVDGLLGRLDTVPVAHRAQALDQRAAGDPERIRGGLAGSGSASVLMAQWRSGRGPYRV